MIAVLKTPLSNHIKANTKALFSSLPKTKNELEISLDDLAKQIIYGYRLSREEAIILTQIAGEE